MNAQKGHVDLFGLDLAERAWIDRRDRSEAGNLRRLAWQFESKGMTATALLLRNDALRIEGREIAELETAHGVLVVPA